MPNQLDVFVLVTGFLRMLMNLHEKDVAQTTAEWMSQLQKDLEDSSREFAAAMAEYEKEQDEAFKILASTAAGLGWSGISRRRRPDSSFSCIERKALQR